MSAPDPRMRIADSDRERAMADLAMHYADGRLEHEEYDERLDAIWTARTRADLAVLFNDLPRPQAAPPAAHARACSRPARSRGAGSRCCRCWPSSIVLSVIADAPLFLLIFPLMWFAHRRRGPWAPPPPGRADYRRHGRLARLVDRATRRAVPSATMGP